jgi:two-component system, NtrC family, response regulator PilR
MQKIKVLVIEDDPASLELYARVLHRADYEVYTASTLVEAKKMLAEHQFNLILSDMEVGSDRALALLGQLNETLQAQGTGIIAISAQENYRRAADEMGIDFFLSKPVSIRTLVNLIDRVTVGKVDRKVPLVLDTREMMRVNTDN